VPPTAPPPTSDGNSPEAPDPHPPAGGIGPLGEDVGGAQLHSRGLILPAGAPALPADLTAAGWVLVDLDSGDVLAARDPHGRYQPASILKTLTTVTLLPLLPGNRAVTVSAGAAGTEGSHAGLVAGGHYTADQLFSGLLLVSGNDAAQALAEAAGGTSRTVALMNDTALRLGAYDTFVETPSGLDGWQQLTSAYDMAIFLRAALQQPRFAAYDRQPTAELPEQHTAAGGFGAVTLANQNEQFLTTVPGALVAKTGYTDAAQHTFVGAVERDGRRLGVVFLRAQRWPQDQWQQATALMAWGLALPPGTAPVGHLDEAVRTAAARSTTTVAAAAPAAGAAVEHRLAASAAGAPSRHPIVLQILVVATLIAAATAFSWRINRRPRPRPAPRP
jgi:D-alanyl-D-alanine carboxypeptidase (penicillin-binding protein 5/6)